MTLYPLNAPYQKDLSMTLPCSRISRFALSVLSTWVLAAAVQADPRDVSYTYTTLGQIATVDGPRTDVSDISRYAYDAQGNMISVTNALNQTTTLSDFDTYGNPQTVTDPNGMIVTFTYTPQGGWLASSTIGASTTSYGYNEVGDVLQITLTDGNFIKYTYSAFP
jgi:YD repeat-containing protein